MIVARYVLLAAFLAALSLTPRATSSQELPQPRAHHDLVFHPVEQRVYLVGGSTPQEGGHRYFDDVWAWDGAEWMQVGALPFPRSSHRVAYFGPRGSLIVFGGGFERAVRTDGILWERGGDGWRAIGGDLRAGTAEPEICQDRTRGELVMFGGWGADNQFRGDTWVWDGEALARADTAGPGPRAGHAFLFDPVRERCLLFGGRGPHGYLSDTWEWDGEGWRRLDVEGPSARWFFGSAADEGRGRVVIFSGRGPNAPVIGRDDTGTLGDTWAWDGEAWELLSTEGPPGRMGGRLAPTGEGVLLFGGRRETREGWEDLNDTWELRGRSWTRRR